MKKIGDVISMNRKKVGLSQSDLALRLIAYDIHIKNAAISSWEKNINMPTAYQLLAICEILDIQDIYSAFIGEHKDDFLADLNEKGKQRVNEYITLLRQSNEFKESKIDNNNLELKSKIMPIAILPASAGLGELVGDEMFEEVKIEEDVPDRADFGVRLNGDSMEPTFKNGQIVWVKKTEVVNFGEVGLFFLDGMTYCKRLIKKDSKIYLLSDNKKYKLIEVKEESNLKTYGVVVSASGEEKQYGVREKDF